MKLHDTGSLIDTSPLDIFYFNIKLIKNQQFFRSNSMKGLPVLAAPEIF